MPAATEAVVPHSRDRATEIPLAPAQRRFWFLNRLEDPTPNYTELMGLRFRGEFSRAATEASLHDVIERHEILRTTFPERDGTARQEILPAADVPMTVRSERIDKLALSRHVRTAARERFDLRSDLPLRAVLFELGADDHLLLLVMHHIAMDAASVDRIIVPELLQAYRARSAGNVPELPPAPMQYADYTLWQLAALGHEDDPGSLISRQIQFWRGALSGVPEHLYLPADHPRGPVPSFNGANLRFKIDPRLHARLVQLGRTHRSTLFMILYAALAGLLTRLGVGTDIPVGTPISRRPPIVNRTAGCFANTIVLRANTAGNPTFVDLLQQIRRTILSASMNAELPFDRVVEAISPRRTLSHNPLFEVLLGLHSITRTAMPRIPDTSVVRMPLRFGDHARFDLAFDLVDSRDLDGAPIGIGGTIQYRTGRFEASTVREIVARYVTFLESIVARPTQRISDVEVFDRSERAWSLVRCGGTSAVEGEPFWPDRFEQQAHRCAEDIAIVCDGTSWTYGELNRRANRLAHELATRGVGPEHVVAVAVPRSLDVFVCSLAVMKTGAAFLLLDVDEPASEMASTLADARPAVVLTMSRATAALPPDCAALVVDDPQVQAAIECGAAGDLVRTGSRRLTAGNALRVAYTAGTTGRRRGVVTTQAGGRQLLAAADAAVGCRRGDRVLAATPVGADAAVLELFVPLLNGATVVLATTPDILYTDTLAGTCRNAGVTVALGTGRFLSPLIDRCGGAPLARLVVHGELAPALLRRQAPDPLPRVARLYGLAEHTVCSVSQVQADDEPGTIGRPANARVYVLDGNLQPLPAGVPGELYAAGPGLARGYVGAGSVTASRFVADPFGEPGARMLRTGDIARWRRDGGLELLGRNGEPWRVATAAEVTAVESALQTGAEVTEVAAVVPDHLSNHRLIGYVASADRPIDLDRVRDRAATLLPGHLVPTAFVALPKLPMTGAWRLDRTALPSPALAPAMRRKPGTPIEERLCALFADVLKLRTVGLDDDFFELGGHSMLVMQLADRARVLGLAVDTRALFEAPTAARLARYVAARSELQP
jgi:amino acid adenylation domain-containing protein